MFKKKNLTSSFVYEKFSKTKWKPKASSFLENCLTERKQALGGFVCSLHCGVTNQQTCVVTVGSRLIPLSAEDHSSFSAPGLQVTDNGTQMEFVVPFYLKSTTSVDFTEPNRHVSVDKSALHLKWNPYWFLGEKNRAHEPSAVLLWSG